MVQLIANRALVYGGKRIAKDGSFDASRRDAFLLARVAKTARYKETPPSEPDEDDDKPDELPPKRGRGRPRKTESVVRAESPERRRPPRPGEPGGPALPDQDDEPADEPEPDELEPDERERDATRPMTTSDFPRRAYRRRDMQPEK